jgi:hypothetical protein
VLQLPVVAGGSLPWSTALQLLLVAAFFSMPLLVGWRLQRPASPEQPGAGRSPLPGAAAAAAAEAAPSRQQPVAASGGSSGDSGMQAALRPAAAADSPRAGIIRRGHQQAQLPAADPVAAVPAEAAVEVAAEPAAAAAASSLSDRGSARQGGQQAAAVLAQQLGRGQGQAAGGASGLRPHAASNQEVAGTAVIKGATQQQQQHSAAPSSAAPSGPTQTSGSGGRRAGLELYTATIAMPPLGEEQAPVLQLDLLVPIVQAGLYTPLWSALDLRCWQGAPVLELPGAGADGRSSPQLLRWLASKASPHLPANLPAADADPEPTAAAWKVLTIQVSRDSSSSSSSSKQASAAQLQAALLSAAAAAINVGGGGVPWQPQLAATSEAPPIPGCPPAPIKILLAVISRCCSPQVSPASTAGPPAIR